MQLTESQNEAIKATLRQFQVSDFATLLGAAGTGKTTIIKELITRSPAFDQVFVVAPTNKAAKVLTDKTDRHCQTVHKLFNLVLRDVEDSQELEQVDRVSFAEQSSLIIIDEASMLNEDLMHLIHTGRDEVQWLGGKLKVLFVGDPCQLNPVGEDQSEALTYPGYELTQIMRQAEGNPIIRLAYEIRERIVTGSRTPIPFQDYVDGEIISSLTKQNEFIDAYLADYHQDRDSHIITWRNATLNSLNNQIRRKLYGAATARNPILEGEEVMLYAPITRESKRGKRRVILENSAIGLVDSVEPTRLHDIDALRVEITCNETSYSFMRPYHQSELDAKLHEIAAKAKLPENSKRRGQIFRDEFYPIKNDFVEARPAHAITSHKSQGSTYQTAFVHVRDILANRSYEEALRSLYVAITRCSERLVLYGV